jgi:hypothetical protein
MKKHEVSEEFLKEAYEAACDSWKEKIRKEFPGLLLDYFEFGRESFEISPCGGNRPLFIGKSFAPGKFANKCLIVHQDFELEQEVYNGRTILKFKYKH